LDIVNADDNEEELRRIDTQLAEKIILDHKLQIQIDNPGTNDKSQEELIKEANECVDKLRAL
jgi:hypothetical protein